MQEEDRKVNLVHRFWNLPVVISLILIDVTLAMVVAFVFLIGPSGGEFEALLFAMRWRFLIAVLAVVLVGIAASVITIRVMGKPLRQLSQLATRIAAGNLSSKFPVTSIKEFSELGQAFEKMRLEVERRNNELSMLLKIDQIIIQDLPLKDVAEAGLKLGLEMMKADAGGFYLVTGGDMLELTAHHGISEKFVDAMKTMKINEGMAGQAIARRQPVTLNITEYPTERVAQIVAGEGLKQFVSAPLILGDKLVGAVNVARKSTMPFLDRDIRLLTSLASQLALSFEKKRLALELVKREERRAAMGRITAAISKTLDVSTIYETLSDELPNLVEYDRLSVAELKGEQLQLSLASKEFSEHLGQGISISTDNRMFYGVIRDGKPVIRHNLEKEALQPIDPQLVSAGINSSILIPLVARGRTFGCLNLGSQKVDNYSEADLEYLQPVADQLAVALDNARLFGQVETAAREWRDTFDAMKDGVAILSADLRIQRVNQAMARIAGTTPKSLLGQHCYRVFHGQEHPPSGCPGIRCLAEKQPCDIVREEPPGGNRWFHTRCDPLPDVNGQITSLVQTMRDITREKVQQDNIEKVYHISQMLSTTLELDKVLTLALDEVLSLVGEPACTACIALIDDIKKQATILASKGLHSDKLYGFTMPLSIVPEEITKILFVEMKPWLVTDTSILPPVVKAIPAADKFQTFVVLPMVRGNKTVGLLFAGSIQTWPIDSEQILLLENYTRQVTLAVENARLYAQMEVTLNRRVGELQALTDVLTVATQGFDMKAILKNALKRAAQALAVERASIGIPNESKTTITIFAVWQQDTESFIEEGVSLDTVGVPPWQKVLFDGEYEIAEDTHLIHDAERLRRVKELGVRSALIVPIKISGRIIGSIQFNTIARPRAYSTEEIELAQAIAGHFAYIIENAQLYERTEKERGTLEAVIASMGEGLIVIDTQRIITYCNHSAEEILDVQAKHILGQPVEVFEGIWGNRVTDSDELEKQWHDAINARAQHPKIEFEISSGGKKHNIETVMFTIGDGESLMGTGILLRDTTREKEIDRMKTEFVSIASHELRTPMTIIYGFTELLLKTKTVPQEQQEWIERIYKETQRLTTIVDDFLNVTRIESGRLTLNLGAVSVQSVAAQLINQLGSNYPTYSFRVDISPDFPVVLADADRLTQVLYNLIDNAAKYSPEGGPVVILARTADNGKQAIISVSDKGLGIPPEEMPRLFTRFHRIHRPEANTIRGTGLGLSIVKAFVEMMNGKVWAESKVNEGSTFYVSLPLANTAAQDTVKY